MRAVEESLLKKLSEILNEAIETNPIKDRQRIAQLSAYAANEPPPKKDYMISLAPKGRRKTYKKELTKQLREVELQNLKAWHQRQREQGKPGITRGSVLEYPIPELERKWSLELEAKQKDLRKRADGLRKRASNAFHIHRTSPACPCLAKTREFSEESARLASRNLRMNKAGKFVCRNQKALELYRDTLLGVSTSTGYVLGLLDLEQELQDAELYYLDAPLEPEEFDLIVKSKRGLEALDQLTQHLEPTLLMQQSYSVNDVIVRFIKRQFKELKQTKNKEYVHTKGAKTWIAANDDAPAEIQRYFEDKNEKEVLTDDEILEVLFYDYRTGELIEAIHDAHLEIEDWEGLITNYKNILRDFDRYKAEQEKELDWDCKACAGSGRDEDGNKCYECEGTGRSLSGNPLLTIPTSKDPIPTYTTDLPRQASDRRETQRQAYERFTRSDDSPDFSWLVLEGFESSAWKGSEFGRCPVCLGKGQVLRGGESSFNAPPEWGVSADYEGEELAPICLHCNGTGNSPNGPWFWTHEQGYQAHPEHEKWLRAKKEELGEQYDSNKSYEEDTPFANIFQIVWDFLVQNNYYPEAYDGFVREDPDKDQIEQGLPGSLRIDNNEYPLPKLSRPYVAGIYDDVEKGDSNVEAYTVVIKLHKPMGASASIVRTAFADVMEDLRFWLKQDGFGSENYQSDLHGKSILSIWSYMVLKTGGHYPKGQCPKCLSNPGWVKGKTCDDCDGFGYVVSTEEGDLKIVEQPSVQFADDLYQIFRIAYSLDIIGLDMTPLWAILRIEPKQPIASDEWRNLINTDYKENLQVALSNLHAAEDFPGRTRALELLNDLYARANLYETEELSENVSEAIKRYAAVKNAFLRIMNFKIFGAKRKGKETVASKREDLLGMARQMIKSTKDVQVPGLQPGGYILLAAGDFLGAESLVGVRFVKDVEKFLKGKDPQEALVEMFKTAYEQTEKLVEEYGKENLRGYLPKLEAFLDRAQSRTESKKERKKLHRLRKNLARHESIKDDLDQEAVEREKHAEMKDRWIDLVEKAEENEIDPRSYQELMLFVDVLNMFKIAVGPLGDKTYRSVWEPSNWWRSWNGFRPYLENYLGKKNPNLKDVDFSGILVPGLDDHVTLDLLKQARQVTALLGNPELTSVADVMVALGQMGLGRSGKK